MRAGSGFCYSHSAPHEDHITEFFGKDHVAVRPKEGSHANRY